MTKQGLEWTVERQTLLQSLAGCGELWSWRDKAHNKRMNINSVFETLFSLYYFKYIPYKVIESSFSSNGRNKTSSRRLLKLTDIQRKKNLDCVANHCDRGKKDMENGSELTTYNNNNIKSQKESQSTKQPKSCNKRAWLSFRLV